MADVRTVICGSPQQNGKCGGAASRLAGLLRLRLPQDEVREFPVAACRIHPCIGCNLCAKLGKCAIRDQMDDVIAALSASRELFAVCPVYFAGPPAQMKALLDRLQPFYYRAAAEGPKRPAHLLVVGDGGDPHGFDPLVGTFRSALSVAGFSLDDVVPCIGMKRRSVLAQADSLVERACAGGGGGRRPGTAPHAAPAAGAGAAAGEGPAS